MGQQGASIDPPSDELQVLLAQLVSRAHELGTRGIYRGERECFPRISSGLYRQLHEINDIYFHIRDAQQRRIELVRQYAPHLSDDDILTRLQHLGGKTNLIDFTRDLNIALFFSSYHSPDRDGRVIFMDEPDVLRGDREPYALYKFVPRGNPATMTDVQKSVWVDSQLGYIVEQDVTIVEIPSALKSEVLEHLRVVYGVEASTVYNDLSGFIRDQERFLDHEAEWHAGVRAHDAGDYDRALGHFAEYEQLVEKPELSLEYFRGISYWHIDRKDEALAAMATFRSRSPHDARAFPEEMESAYAKHQRASAADRRRIGSDGGAQAAEVVPGFRIRLVSEDGTPIRARMPVTVTHETGASQQALLDKDAFVSFPGLTPEAEGTWVFSANLLLQRNYQDSQPMSWPIQETVVLKAIDGNAPNLRVEIESLQYTYEPGITGPLVAYPARAAHTRGPTA